MRGWHTMTTETFPMTFPSRFLNRQRVIAFQLQWRASVPSQKLGKEVSPDFSGLLPNLPTPGNFVNELLSRHTSNFKMKERSGNVYENKGSVWQAPERSRNVIENKATYSIIAGI